MQLHKYIYIYIYVYTYTWITCRGGFQLVMVLTQCHQPSQTVVLRSYILSGLEYANSWGVCCRLLQ